MKTGRTLTELATELQRQAGSKRDYIADTRAIRSRVSDDQIILEGIGGGLPIAPTAHEQLSATLQIPKPYYDRMMANAPDLLVRNINHWLEASPSRKMVRTLDGRVRGIMSDRYRPLDNLDLAEAILPKLSQLEGQVISGEVTDKRFYLKAVTPKIAGVVTKIDSGRHVRTNDVIQAGIVVSNSEIGFGSLKIEELTYRLVCLNGAIHAQVTRQTHAGRRSNYDAESLLEQSREFYRDETRAADDKAFFLKVRDAVGATLTQERLDKHLLQMQGAAEKKIEADPVQVVEVTTKRFGLGEAERGSILKRLIEGADLSAFGLAQAITRASQDVESYELATVMEQAGGEVIEMSKGDWAALAS